MGGCWRNNLLLSTGARRERAWLSEGDARRLASARETSVSPREISRSRDSRRERRCRMWNMTEKDAPKESTGRGGEGISPLVAPWWGKTASGTHMARKGRDFAASGWYEREGTRLDGRTGEGSPVDGESRERGSQSGGAQGNAAESVGGAGGVWGKHRAFEKVLSCRRARPFRRYRTPVRCCTVLCPALSK